MQAITIGRSNTNNVMLTDMSVSREHAKIIRFDNGAYSITDLNSTNGTYVNGQRINGTVALYENDTVRIGETTLPWKEYFNDGSVSREAQTGGGEIATQPVPQKKGANVFAILGFIFAFVASPLGLVFSIIGLSKAKKMGGKQKGLAIAGLIISIISIVLMVIYITIIAGTIGAIGGAFDTYDYYY